MYAATADFGQYMEGMNANDADISISHWRSLTPSEFLAWRDPTRKGWLSLH